MLLASFQELLGYIGYVLLSILVLLLMITVHEAGHYFAGKILGFGVEEFSIGFGPKIFSKKKKNGEIFSVRLIPFGGYCAFTGEDKEDDNENAFNNKSPWKRIIVLISGAFMNYILALVIIFTMFGIYGQTAYVPVKMNYNEIYTTENSLNEKDVIIRADNKNIYLITDAISVLSGKQKDETVNFTVIRNGKTTDINVTLRETADFKNMEDVQKLYDVLGIYYSVSGEEITETGLYATSVRFSFFETVGRGVEYSFKLAGTIFTVLGQLLTGRIGLSSMGGTVTTIAVTANAIRQGGLRYLLYISSFIGVNLAVFNLLPIPALDGSRVVFTLIEWIRKKPISRKAEGIIHVVGFALILCFAVFVDLQHCF
ncbi:MAG: site-2 protease family protein [Clostridia bacterium]|nr:site-2 protease family protein [Clostridia bacterium]